MTPYILGTPAEHIILEPSIENLFLSDNEHFDSDQENMDPSQVDKGNKI